MCCYCLQGAKDNHMMLHVTGRGFVAQQPHVRLTPEDLEGFDGYNVPSELGIPFGLSGLGMTAEEAQVMLATGNGTPEQLKVANILYYGPQVPGATHTSGGYYGSQPSVVAANGGGNTIAQPDYPGDAETPPNLYAMEDCLPMDGACMQRNIQRETANQILTINARNAYNRSMCEYNYALNVNETGNTSWPYECGQYIQMAVPAAPGVPSTPVTASGQVLAAVIGQTVTNKPSGTTPVYPSQTSTAERLPNNQTQAAASTGKPNQSVPPNPSPGTVPISPITSAAQKLTTSTINGTAPAVDDKTEGDPFDIMTDKIWGVDAWILLAGAGVAAFLYMKRGQ